MAVPGGDGGSAGGVPGTPITPSPLRSWWKLVSMFSSTVLLPETPGTGLETQLPALSVFQIRFWSWHVSFQGHVYAVDVCAVPIAVQPPVCPATTAAPLYPSSGPVPLLMLSR